MLKSPARQDSDWQIESQLPRAVTNLTSDGHSTVVCIFNGKSAAGWGIAKRTGNRRTLICADFSVLTGCSPAVFCKGVLSLPFGRTEGKRGLVLEPLGITRLWDPVWASRGAGFAISFPISPLEQKQEVGGGLFGFFFLLPQRSAEP